MASAALWALDLIWRRLAWSINDTAVLGTTRAWPIRAGRARLPASWSRLAPRGDPSPLHSLASETGCWASRPDVGPDFAGSACCSCDRCRCPEPARAVAIPAWLGISCSCHETV